MCIFNKENKILLNYSELGSLGCTCAVKNNKYGEGSECNLYSGYDDEWNNGIWCYADVESCADAKEHPSNLIPGYGISKAACSGKVMRKKYISGSEKLS